MEYKTVKEISEQWGISDRHVRLLCQQGIIDGVIQKGRSYLIPENTIKPVDKRYTKNKTISPHYQPIFAKIDELKDTLDQRRPLTQGELKRLHEKFTIEFTYDSNAIKGNTLTLQETAMVLEGITIDTKSLTDHLEVVGHKNAFKYVQRIVSEKVELSEFVIKNINTLVLMDHPEYRGLYRQIPVRIIGASHEPPQPYLVPIQMEQLLQELKKEQLHPIEAAALFHLKVEGIHPFIDGNGRTGRLILNFMLMQNGYPPINVKFADRRKYYGGFEEYYNNADHFPMVKMIANYVEEQLALYLRIIS
ncbi:MAG: Fic family protein [Proteocatella sp.]